MMRHLNLAVPESAKALGQVQTPFFDMASEDFPIALLIGGKGLGAIRKQPPKQSTPQLPPVKQTFHNYGQTRAIQGGNFHGTVNFSAGDNVGPGNDED
jgi:hypothetical protein